MRMNKQTRTFAKQVQVDLLTLSDHDLFQTVHLWVNEEPSEPFCEISKETRSILGYTLGTGQRHIPSSNIPLESAFEAGMGWFAPTPQQLRELLIDMNLELFIEHVLPLAFQSLHMMHPEWGEGATFNAHLANHLRTIGMRQKGMTKGPETPQSRLPRK
jgi:hypothetical protein